MAVPIELHYIKTFPSSLDTSQTVQFLSDWERHISGHFPRIEKFERIAPGVFRWIFPKVGHSGFEYQLKMVTRLKAESARVVLTGVPEDGHALANGEWRVESRGGITQVTFDVHMRTELGIPFLLKGVATALTHKEMIKIYDEYIANVAKTLS